MASVVPTTASSAPPNGESSNGDDGGAVAVEGNQKEEGGGEGAVKEEEEEEEEEVSPRVTAISIVNNDEEKPSAVVRAKRHSLSKKGPAPTGKNALLLWAQNSTEGYAHVNITNFSSSFKSGMAFCALIHAHRPHLIHYHTLDPNNAAVNLETAFAAGEQIGVDRTYHYIYIYICVCVPVFR